MGKLSRTKGATWERELARRFGEVMPGAKVRRGLQDRDGVEAADVDCPCFWVEAKHQRKPRPRAALEQAEEAAPKGRVPVAVIKEQRKRPYVVIRLDEFLEFVGEWWELRNG